MARGRPKKKVEEPVKPEPVEVEESDDVSAVVESKKQEPGPCNSDQQYFEAPDGTIIVGEKSATRIWYRAGNDGEGMWIRPKR